MPIVYDSTKTQATRRVAELERMTARLRVEQGPVVKGLLDALPHWDDSHTGLFSEGWDSKQNLYRRLSAARSSALIETGRGQASESVAGAAASGFVEGAREGAASLAETVKAWGPRVGIGLALALALGLFLRARG